MKWPYMGKQSCTILIIYLDLRVGWFSCRFSLTPSLPDEYASRRPFESVEALQEHPKDPDQILIGYSRGLMMVWDVPAGRSVQHFLGTQVSAGGSTCMFIVSPCSVITAYILLPYDFSNDLLFS